MKIVSKILKSAFIKSEGKKQKGCDNMTLLEIISMVSDGTEKVQVTGCDGTTLSEYNGRDSIDECYNDLEVFYIEVSNNTLILWVMD